MRKPLLAVATVLVAVVVLSAVSREDADDASTAAPGSSSAPPAPGAVPGPGVPDHEDDYGAPPEELIDHADHLDFDRLPPDTRRWIEDELARRQALVDGLWSAYGPVLARQPDPDMPAELRLLEAYELGYVLMSARAEQLAAAVAATGSLDAAQARPEVGAEHPEVDARVDGRCVTVAFAHDPFDRAFGAESAAAGGTSLPERVEQRVRVGAAGEPACGGSPVSFSPSARTALDVLAA